MNRNTRSPKVSVITPLYNSSPHIEETLNSLCRQTFDDWESILVDDGSTDDTAEKVKPYLSDRRFNYIKQANAGVAAARNTAIKSADGEWVCLLDHDDRWLPEKLEKQLAFADAHDYDVVCTDAMTVQRRSRKRYNEFYPGEFIDKLRRSSTDPAVDVFELLIRHNFLCASSVMLRRHLFDRVGLFNKDAAPADDYDMWLRCMPDARMGYLEDPLIEYSIHTGNASHNFTRMVEKTIFVLHKSAERLRDDPRRVKQFESSLIAFHRILLTELFEKHRYGSALRHVAALVAGERNGLRLLYHVAGSDLRTTLRKSFGAKSTSQRSVYGKQNLDAASDDVREG